MLSDEWIVLGSGTAVPDARRGSACHLLRTHGVGILFDAGSGAKDRLAARGVTLGSLRYLFFTHAHLDHWADLLSLLFYRMHAPPEDRQEGMIVAGPAGFGELVRDVAWRIDPDLIDRNCDVRWVDVEPGQVVDGGAFRATAFAVEHGSRAALAYRVQGASGAWSLCYSGDTRPCEGLDQAAQGVGWLVCECSFPDELGRKNHMTPRGVRSLAERAGVRRVVLTHLYPEMDRAGLGEAFDGFEGEVRVAEDGTTLALAET